MILSLQEFLCVSEEEEKIPLLRWGRGFRPPLILPMDPLRLVDSNSKTSIIVIDNDKKKERKKKKKNALELCQESCAGQYSGMN